MPLYDFECKECGRLIELFFHMNDDKVGRCDKCGSEAHRVYSRFDISGDIGHKYEYFDETLGVQVHSKRQREAEMARQGLRQHEPDSDRLAVSAEAKYIRKHGGGADGEREIKQMRKSASANKRKERLRPLREAAKRVAIGAIKEHRND